MGVKVQVKKRELYPVGEYLAKAITNEMDRKNPARVCITFEFLQGPMVGKRIMQGYPNALTPGTNLGKMVLGCGFALPSGENESFDLDALMNFPVYITVSHWTAKDGTIMNGIEGVRRAAAIPGQVAAVPAQTVAQAPAAQPQFAPQQPAASYPQQAQYVQPVPTQPQYVQPAATAPASVPAGNVAPTLKF